MHCGVSYVKTWGILAESCKQSTIIYNKISKCLRQSGINAIVNSSGEGTIIVHNNISECSTGCNQDDLVVVPYEVIKLTVK